MLALADGDDSLNDNARLIILGALDSDQSLEDVLGGGGQTLAEAAAAVEDAPIPIGAYLKSVSVAGFRGIGEQLTVKLHTGPGLTIIAGRNGSGKSSIAEALEMALTGQSYRWRRQSAAVWTANWRNLHADTPAEIRVELAEEGAGITTIGVDWSSDAGLHDGACWVQRKGQKRQSGRESLGWDAALDLYRPLLSYDEVGGVLEGPPSGLHDKLHSLLGLEPITDGQKRLTIALKALQIAAAEAKSALLALKSLLADSEDPRATQALALLSKRTPNKDAVEQLATGSTAEVDSTLSRLKTLAALTWPAERQMCKPRPTNFALPSQRSPNRRGLRPTRWPADRDYSPRRSSITRRTATSVAPSAEPDVSTTPGPRQPQRPWLPSSPSSPNSTPRNDD
ncbi:energy-coupling factor transporter ATP-binding protein EcfA2 [Nakamurella sp. UYEF19]|uniref:AAA family ATPase n=1 Tax=Nakamurella sp. UYEF19 TaxID=1756392 RepID=UPI00339680A4